MAVQKLVSMEGSAFLVASAGNINDYQDCKQFFKSQLEKAENQATTDAEKLRLYRAAVRGFLMELDPLSSQYQKDHIKRVQLRKTLLNDCGVLTGFACAMGLLATMMAGITGLCLIKLFS